MPTWLSVTIGIVVAVAVIAATMIKILGKKKQAGEPIGWLDVALALAQGIDDAKDAVPADAKAKMMGAITSAAVASGKHGDVKEFLTRFGFNRSTPSA